MYFFPTFLSTSSRSCALRTTKKTWNFMFLKWGLVSCNYAALWCEISSHRELWAARTLLEKDVPLSLIHSGGGCGCFLPGRKMLARDHNACSCSQSPLKYSSHNFSVRLYVFSRWLHFWVENKVVKGIWFHLLPWEQRWMKMFHGSLGASPLCACVCTHVCARETLFLWFLVPMCVYAHVLTWQLFFNTAIEFVRKMMARRQFHSRILR